MRRRLFLAVGMIAVMLATLNLMTARESSAGTGDALQWGNDAVAIVGDWQYSTIYADGIELSPGNTTSAGAYWSYNIDPPSRTYYLSITVNYSDNSWFGDGADLYVKNVYTSEWDVAMTLGQGTNVTSSSSLIPMFYVGDDGLVTIYLHADIMDDADVNYIKLTWGYDDCAPVNPWWYSSDPSSGDYASGNIIHVQWFGAHDDQNTVEGYSVLWSANSTELPDETMDTTTSAIISPPLADGIWYLHVRSVDSVGNWNATSFDMGPFMIDTTAPTLVVLGPVDESVCAVCNVTVAWLGTDLCSEVDHYEVSVDGGAWLILGLEESVALTNLTDAYHTVVIRAFDCAGNVATTTVNFGVSAEADIEGDGSGAYLVGWVMALIILLIIGLIVVGVIMMLRRRGGEENPEQ